jgi:hypothetical protein
LVEVIDEVGEPGWIEPTVGGGVDLNEADVSLLVQVVQSSIRTSSIDNDVLIVSSFKSMPD